MKFLLPKDLRKFRYYCELLAEIHGKVELNRLSYTRKWSKYDKTTLKKKLKDIEDGTIVDPRTSIWDVKI